MTTKEFRIVMTFSVSAFLLLLGLFGLVAFKVDLFAPSAVQAATYTLSPTYAYTNTVPGLLSYQGFLADGEGNPLTGNYQMTFGIYATMEGGPPLWTETDAEVVVRGGEFSVLLGDETPFPENLFAQPDRYLGVQVGSNPEMTPRQRFASVAFAMHANDGVPSGAIIIWTSNDGTCPSGYARVSSLDGQFLRGALAFGGTGGSETHNHAGSTSTNGNHTHNIHSVGSHDHDIDGDEVCGMGGTRCTRASSTRNGGGHDHGMDGAGNHSHTISDDSNLPPYTDVVFCQRD